MFTWLWLPDAMEGPTPVSSLLHSATLVLAGIIMWCHEAVVLSSSTLLLCSVCGWVLVCLGYNVDGDYKKLGAVSTCCMVTMV